ncbi:hypothetical protein [Streptomyces sp. NBC_00878]|uniref:hypothetical protein n=1 Tax=Streptomyces sp. NBC_00878 TaxID=2975854 RepID=UPI0022506128|nr:hypothetical protein [Streptomyces sp. NBC_00878]MCX4906754.1 hypothetical protein [Streptomyces sp. NBC_00878]
MGQLVTVLCELLLRVLLPARGRHRGTPTTTTAAPPDRSESWAPAAPPCRCQLSPGARNFEWDTPLARPYLRDMEVSA